MGEEVVVALNGETLVVPLAHDDLGRPRDLEAVEAAHLASVSWIRPEPRTAGVRWQGASADSAMQAVSGPSGSVREAYRMVILGGRGAGG